MRALFIHGPSDLRTESIQEPQPGDGQVRIRLAYTGICGSDLHYYFQGRNGVYSIREPMIPGHEVSGTVDLDPSGTWTPGTPVTVHPATFGPALEASPTLGRHLRPGGSYLGSASTDPHTHGGMAEKMLVRIDQLRAIPLALSLRDAALAEPLAVSLHAVRIAGDLQGRSVLIAGAGPIGLLTLAAARDAGARSITVTDVLPDPLRRARELGAEATLRVGEDEIPEEAYDVAFECSAAAPSITACIGAVKRAGIVVQVGILPDETIGVNLGPLVSKEVQYRGTFRFEDEIGEAVDLLGRNPALSGIVTHVIPAQEAERAFEIARDSSVSGKVLVSLWHEDGSEHGD